MDKIGIGMQNILVALNVEPVDDVIMSGKSNFGRILGVTRLMALIIGISLLLVIISCKIKKKKVNGILKICFIISIITYIVVKLIEYYICMGF